jgi:hypothetical protein
MSLIMTETASPSGISRCSRTDDASPQKPHRHQVHKIRMRNEFSGTRADGSELTKPRALAVLREAATPAQFQENRRGESVDGMASVCNAKAHWDTLLADQRNGRDTDQAHSIKTLQPRHVVLDWLGGPYLSVGRMAWIWKPVCCSGGGPVAGAPREQEGPTSRSGHGYPCHN